MERKITVMILGILLFGATELGAQINPASSQQYRGPVYTTIPAKSIEVKLLSPEEVSAGARVRFCKGCRYPQSLQKRLKPDSLFGQSSLNWTPQMEDTSRQVHIIPYWIVKADGREQLAAVRVNVLSFPERTAYHFRSDAQGRLDFAIAVNHWTENVEIDILDEQGRIVKQLRDVYKGKLDLPEGNYTAKTRITATFPILSNFTDTFRIRRPENEEIPPVDTLAPTMVFTGEFGSWITNENRGTPDQKDQTEPVDEVLENRGTERLIQTELKVYPNPTNGKLNVLSNKSISHLSVLNVNGSQISQANPMSTEYQRDLSGLPPGYYFIRIQLEDGTVETVKLVLSAEGH